MAKLDKIKFAQVIGFIQRQFAISMNTNELTELDDLIDMPEPEPQLVPGKADPVELDMLLFLMAQGNQKINAIKQYRMITGMGLKDSKDAVERHWVSKVVNPMDD